MVGIPCALGAALLGGNIGILGRMAPQRHLLEIPLVGLFVGSLLLCPLLLFFDAYSLADYENIDWSSRHVLMVLIISSGGLVAIIMETEGYRYANYAVASLLGYLEIPLSFVLQLVIFHERVTMIGFVGASLVLLSTVVNAWVGARLKNVKHETEEALAPVTFDNTETSKLFADVDQGVRSGDQSRDEKISV